MLCNVQLCRFYRLRYVGVCVYDGDVTSHICIRMRTVNIRDATLCGNWNQSSSKDWEDDLNEDRRSVVC